MLKLTFTILLCLNSLPAFATTGEEVLAALEAKVKITHMNSWTQSISQPGTILVVQKQGLALGDLGSLNKKTVILNGELVSAGGGSMGGALFGNGSTGHQLKPGDKVYLYEDHPNPKRDGIWFKILSVDTYDVQDHGQTKQKRGDLLVDFYYDKPLLEMTTDQVLADLSKWLKTENEASESNTVKIGQSAQEVEEILGKPEKRIDLGEKKVFVYKDMKIIFIKGKVSDVQ
jgi:hypothetical protein